MVASGEWKEDLSNLIKNSQAKGRKRRAAAARLLASTKRQKVEAEALASAPLPAPSAQPLAAAAAAAAASETPNDPPEPAPLPTKVTTSIDGRRVVPELPPPVAAVAQEVVNAVVQATREYAVLRARVEAELRGIEQQTELLITDVERFGGLVVRVEANASTNAAGEFRLRVDALAKGESPDEAARAAGGLAADAPANGL